MAVKPQGISGYGAEVTAACERVLVTLLRSLGPWRDTVYLIGGLTPRYLIKARPPEIAPHAGTGDVDLVIDMAMLAEVEAYRTLEGNLEEIGFSRVKKPDGTEVSWRWEVEVGHGKVVLEFLTDDPKLGASKIQVLPTDSKVTACNIPHASMVQDFHEKVVVTADLLNDGGTTSETVRFADIVSFTALKALAFDDRALRKDAHDLVYCLEHYEGGVEAAVEMFRAALQTKHAAVLRRVLDILRNRFADADPERSYRREGPVAVARFEDDDADVGTDEAARNARILRQRRAADVVTALITPLL